MFLQAGGGIMPCPSKITPALGSPDERQPVRETPTKANTHGINAKIPRQRRIKHVNRFSAKCTSSCVASCSWSSFRIILHHQIISEGLISRMQEFARELGPANLSLDFASQVGNCKFVLVILTVHERRNLLRRRCTWIPNPKFDDKRRFRAPHVAFSGIRFISTIVDTRHCCKRLWHQALLQAPSLGLRPSSGWLKASILPNKCPQSSAPTRIQNLNTKLLISPRPPHSYNSTARNATEPHQQLTNISSKAPNATKKISTPSPHTHP